MSHDYHMNAHNIMLRTDNHTTLQLRAVMAAEATQSFSNTTMENARKAKVSMEQFYENLLIQDRDRTNRWRKLELSMEDMALSEEEVLIQVREIEYCELTCSVRYTRPTAHDSILKV